MKKLEKKANIRMLSARKKLNRNKKYMREILVGGASVMALTGASALSNVAFAQVTLDETNNGDPAAERNLADKNYTVTPAAGAVNRTETSITTTSGNVIVQDKNSVDAGTSVTVEENLTIGTGDLTVQSVQTVDKSDSDIILTVEGNASVGGLTTISTNAATNANDKHTATLVVEGDATFTGLVKVNSVNSANAGSNATLTLQGATNTFTGGLELFGDDGGGGGSAILSLDSTKNAMSVAGAIDGGLGGSGESNINVFSSTADAAANMVTFSGEIGATNEVAAINVGFDNQAGHAVFEGGIASAAINVTGGDNAAEVAVAEFQNNVNLSNGITLEDGTATATVIFRAAEAAGYGVAGKINGKTVGEGAVVVLGVGEVGFDSEIGDTKALGSFTVGSATESGSAGLSENAKVEAILVIGEGSVLGVRKDLTATTTTLTGGTLKLNADGAQDIAGTINGAGTLQIVDTDTLAAEGATFSGTIGDTTALTAIEIGGDDAGGKAQFDAAVKAAALTLTAGDAGTENALATFDENVTFETVTLTGGGDAAADATLTLKGDALALGAVTLNDETGQAILAIDTGTVAAAGGGTVAGTIDAAAPSDDGEGQLTIVDSANADAKVVTFSGDIGATARLSNITVGSTGSGEATFKGSVAAKTINVTGGGAAGKDSMATFESGVDATTITLSDNTATAKVVFGGEGDRTITANITAAADNEGEIQVSSTKGTVTFENVIGTSAVAGGAAAVNLRAITLNAGTTTVFNKAINVTGDLTVNAATVTFGAATTTNLVLQKAGDDDATAIFRSSDADLTIGGTIKGATAGDGAVVVLDGDGGEDGTITFNGVIGATELGSLTVGSADLTGSAVLAEDATIGAISVIGGGGDSVLEVQKALSSVETITLSDASGTATLKLDAKGGNQTIDATIDGPGAAADAGDAAGDDDDDAAPAASVSAQGALQIVDTDGGAPDLFTFSEAVGGTNALRAITIGTIGDAKNGGNALFSDAVAATALTLAAGDAAGENASATINGDATFSTVTLTGGSFADVNATLTLKGETLALGAVTLDDNDDEALGQATLTIETGAEAAAVTGTIDGGAADEGQLIVAGSVNGSAAEAAAFSGAVGATNRLKSLAIGSATQSGTATFNGSVAAEAITITGGEANEDSAATFKGDVAAETITLTDTVGTASLLLSGTGDQTIGGDIAGDAGAIQNTNTGGTVTFAGSIGVADTPFGGTITFDEKTTTVFNGAVVLDGALTVDSNVTFNDGLTVGGALTVSEEATVALNEVVTVPGVLTLSDKAVISLGSDIKAGATVFTVTNAGADVVAESNTVTFNMPPTLGDGKITLISDTDDAADISALVAEDAGRIEINSTALYEYSVALPDPVGDVQSKNAIEVTSTQRPIAETADFLGVTVQEATALSEANKAVVTGEGDFGDDKKVLRDAFVAALSGTTAEATLAAEQVAVQADTLGALSAVAITTGAQVVGVASSRLASVRGGTQFANAQQTGFSTGNGGLGSAAWLRPFGNWVTQDDSGGIRGYDSNTYGISVGLDTEVAAGVRLGGSFAYSKTDVDGKGAGRSNIDIDSYQFTLYSDYTTDGFYVEGMVGYARNTNETSRRLTFGGLDRTAKGEYDSNQYMVMIGGGAPISLQGNSFLTPMGSLSYTQVSSENYTETGAGDLSMRVDTDSVNAFVGSLGARFHTEIQQRAGGRLVPSANLGLSYDFSGDEATVTGTYTGGGAAFKVKGIEVEKFAGNAGLGIAYDDGIWSIGANYDAEFKSDYTGHSATLDARFKF